MIEDLADPLIHLIPQCRRSRCRNADGAAGRRQADEEPGASGGAPGRRSYRPDHRRRRQGMNAEKRIRAKAIERA